MNNNTKNSRCQAVQKILQKTAIKKQSNKKTIAWLESIGESEKAAKIEQCASHLGITYENGIAKVVQADFCRERICSVCAWRRQAKFYAQMVPTIDYLSERKYKFLFLTLTAKNVQTKAELKTLVDNMLNAYHLFQRRREIRRTWKGMCRSVEITHTVEKGFHPHIHCIIAVDENYFKGDYLSQEFIRNVWQECLRVNYKPMVNIKRIKDKEKGIKETFKYAFKPSDKAEDMAALYSAFLGVLKGKRLVSFSGVFAKVRKVLKFADFETVLTDELQGKVRTYELYRFDVTGGIYAYQERLKL